MKQKFNAGGCNFQVCKNYPEIIKGELVAYEICKMCTHFRPFNLLEKEEDANTKNSKNKDKK